MAVGTRLRDNAAQRRDGLATDAALVGLAHVPAIATFAVATAVGVAGGGFKPAVWRLSTIALIALASAALIARERITLARGDRLSSAASPGLPPGASSRACGRSDRRSR